MAKTLEMIFDFGSPNAYLAYRALTPVLERTGAVLKITPCLLGGIFKATNNQPPLIAFGPVKGKTDYIRLEINRFIKRHRLTDFQFNPHFPVNTLMLMRAACALEGDARFSDFIEAGLAAMWEKGLKMDDADVFAAALSDAGFDGAALLASTADPTVKQRLMDNTAAAVERGVFGIPSFFVGEEMYFGKETLPLLEEELAV